MLLCCFRSERTVPARLATRAETSFIGQTQSRDVHFHIFNCAVCNMNFGEVLHVLVRLIFGMLAMVILVEKLLEGLIWDAWCAMEILAIQDILSVLVG